MGRRARGGSRPARRVPAPDRAEHHVRDAFRGAHSRRGRVAALEPPTDASGSRFRWCAARPVGDGARGRRRPRRSCRSLCTGRRQRRVAAARPGRDRRGWPSSSSWPRTAATPGSSPATSHSAAAMRTWRTAAPRPSWTAARSISPAMSDRCARRKHWTTDTVSTSTPMTAPTRGASCCRRARIAKAVLRDFARRVFVHQPLELAKHVATDFTKAFALRRIDVSAGRAPLTMAVPAPLPDVPARSDPRGPDVRRWRPTRRRAARRLPPRLSAQCRGHSRIDPRRGVHRRAGGGGRRWTCSPVGVTRRVLATDTVRVERLAGGRPVHFSWRYQLPALVLAPLAERWPSPR